MDTTPVPCHAMSCHVMSCHVMSWCPAFHHVAASLLHKHVALHPAMTLYFTFAALSRFSVFDAFLVSSLLLLLPSHSVSFAFAAHDMT